MKSLIVNQHILFIGYNLEDNNIQVMLEKVSDELLSLKKESYFVSPKLPKHKINWLIQKGIHYIDSTGEEFIIQLLDNIKENIFDDFQKKLVSPDTFRNFTISNNLRVSIEGNESSYDLKSISANKGHLKYNMDVTFKKLSTDLQNLISGKEFGTVEINDSNLSKFRLTSESGIKILDLDSGSIKFKSNPVRKLKVDLSFADSYELNNQFIEVYASRHKIEVRLLLNAGLIILDSDPKLRPDNNQPEMKIRILYKLNELYSLRDGIQLFKVLTAITSGQEVTIYFDGGKSFKKTLPFFEPFYLHVSSILKYFENLKIIEHNYNLNFPLLNLNNITDELVDKIEDVAKMVNYGENIYENNIELKLRLNDSNEAIKELININDEQKISPVIIENRNTEFLTIHDLEINLGKQVIEIIEPSVVNLDQVINGRNKYVIIKSKVNKYKVRIIKDS